MDVLAMIISAFATALNPVNFISLFIAVVFGIIVGMLPGLTSTMAVALLTGLTFGLPKEAAIASLLGVYVGAVSGGCQSAILINIPGTPASAATAMDGFPLAKSGRAGYAIFCATLASALGTIISVLFVMFLTPTLSRVGLAFGSYEFFMLALFGVVICGNLASNGDPLKGWIAGFIGLLAAQIGRDGMMSYPRFTFGSLNLQAGLREMLIPVMIALFGFPELVKAFQKSTQTEMKNSKLDIGDGLSAMIKNWGTVIRSSIIGVFIGIVPGVGEDIGGWLSYWSAKVFAKKDAKESFGKGNITGVIAAETGNNSCIGGAVIPVLSLAVPGSTSAAVLLAAFWLHGYKPGPLLMSETPEFLYQVSAFLLVASICMFFVALFISKFTVKILSLSKEMLTPLIFVFCAIGAYLGRYNYFDIKLVFVVGILGFFFVYAKFPAAPLLLGVVLGPMADENLRRALRLSKGSLEPFFTRPISLVFVVVVVILLISQTPLPSMITQALKRKKADA